MPFQYTPYRNRYVGSITDLMGRGRDAEAQALITAANAQAQAAQVSGQAWGGALQGIGNTIAAIPGQMQAAEDREYLTAQRERVAEAQGREDLERANKDRLSAIFANQVSGVTPSRVGGIPGMEYTTPPLEAQGGVEPAEPVLPSRQLGPAKHPYQVKQDGAWLFDIEGFHRAAAEAGPGVLEQAGPFIKQMSSMNDWRKGVIESGKSEARETASFLSALPDDALLRSAPAAIRMFEGVLDQDVLDALTGLVEQGDAVGLRKALNAFTGTPSQRMAVRPGERIVDFSTGDVTEGPPAAPTPLTEGALNRLEYERERAAGNTTASYNRWLTEEKTLDKPPTIPARPTEGELNRLEYERERSAGNTTASYNRWLTEEKTLPKVVEPDVRSQLVTNDQGVIDVAASMTALGLDPAPHEDKLWDRADMTTTGVGSAFVRAFGPTTGLGEESMANMTAIDLVREMATRSLAENPRLAVAERAAIREGIDIDTGIWESPDKVRVKFRELETVLRRALDRKNELDDIGVILQTIDILGVPAETNRWGRTGDVEMLAPDGVELITVPPGEVEHYESRGATRVQ
jgi:hypothetical protein